MPTRKIATIIEEFNGQNCILRLTNGQLITGIIGEMITSSLICVRVARIGNDINIPLMDIDALCLA